MVSLRLKDILLCIDFNKRYVTSVIALILTLVVNGPLTLGTRWRSKSIWRCKPFWSNSPGEYWQYSWRSSILVGYFQCVWVLKVLFTARIPRMEEGNVLIGICLPVHGGGGGVGREVVSWERTGYPHIPLPGQERSTPPSPSLPPPPARTGYLPSPRSGHGYPSVPLPDRAMTAVPLTITKNFLAIKGFYQGCHRSKSKISFCH